MKVIITGASGMVGEGVMHVCINNPMVSNILLISRKKIEIDHPKIEQIIHQDFSDISPILPQIQNFDGCFFCSGISSIGVDKETYFNLTYNLTLSFAKSLISNNPTLTFCYVSGQGTDSTEVGMSHWARTKGKTENDLMKLPFRQVFAFRPGFIKPMEGMVNTQRFYKYINWMFPIGKNLFPNHFITLEEIGKAMINVVRKGYKKKIVEGVDIAVLAKIE